MDKAIAKKLADVIVKAANDALKAHGYTAQYKGGTFDSATFKPKLLISSATVDVQKMEFLRYADLFKLQPTHYGVTFNANGETYALIGLKPSSPRFPVIGRRADGKQFKFTSGVLDQLRVKR